ncbi:MAG: TetR/AcrR family transcriptional regulator [Pirellulaceae bacterium]
MSATPQLAPEDPRVKRSRLAAIEAARTLFLRNGYAGTTMEDIAKLAGLSKRTLYNIYADKETLFTQMIADALVYAEGFARGLAAEFDVITAENMPDSLYHLGHRLALAILRPEVIALRRLLIGEARSFPEFAEQYFNAAPGRVLVALATGFEQLSDIGLLEATDALRAAEQFAYLVVGAPLDRAILIGKIPSKKHIVACARHGVETFLVRYRTIPRAN